MRLLEITTEAILGVPNGKYTFAHAATGEALPLAVIAGGAASGKTGLIEAIIAAKEATGAYGMPPTGARLLRRGAATGRLLATWLLSDAERARARAQSHTCAVEIVVSAGVDVRGVSPELRQVFETYEHGRGIGKVEYFHADRILPARSGSSPMLTAALDADRRLEPRSDKYEDLPGALSALCLADALQRSEIAEARGVATRADGDARLAAIRSSLASILSEVRLDGMRVRDGVAAPRFVRRDGGQLSLGELSGSERQIVLFCLAFHHFALEGSLVLIDEPELHLPPGIQRSLLGWLLGLGADNQIIVATSSADIAASVDRCSIVDVGADPGRRTL